MMIMKMSLFSFWNCFVYNQNSDIEKTGTRLQFSPCSTIIITMIEPEITSGKKSIQLFISFLLHIFVCIVANILIIKPFILRTQ